MICAECKNELTEAHSYKSRPFPASSPDFGKKEFICDLREYNNPCTNFMKEKFKNERERKNLKYIITEQEFVKEISEFMNNENEINPRDYSELYIKLSLIPTTVDKVKKVLKHYHNGGECMREITYGIIYKWLN